MVKNEDTTPFTLSLSTKKWCIQLHSTSSFTTRERNHIMPEKEDGRTPAPVWMSWRRDKDLSLLQEMKTITQTFRPECNHYPDKAILAVIPH
jgi:hypothetical protein